MAKNLNIAKSVTPIDDMPHQIMGAPAVTKSDKERAKAKMAELIAEETRIVRGVFQCFETPGATTKIVVRKYPGIPHFEKTMTDGETYDIPLYVARHLNGIDASAGAASDVKNPNIGTCSYPVHGFKWKNEAPVSQMGAGPAGEGGIPVPIVGVAKRVKRFGFQSMEFAGI